MSSGMPVRTRKFATYAALVLVACDPYPEVSSTRDVSLAVVGLDELARMQRYIDELYEREAVVHSFRSLAGDEIDCVPLEEQPSLRGSGVDPQAIPRAPRNVPIDPRPTPREGPDDELTAARMFGLEGIDENGAERRCPPGAIPIRRLDLATVARFRTLEDFLRMHPNSPSDDPECRSSSEALDVSLANTTSPLQQRRVGASNMHQYAKALQFVDNRGAESHLNVWSPFTEKALEHSTSQIWVYRGSMEDKTHESVEAGWHVLKALYGDGRPHFFIYFAPDSYGCQSGYNFQRKGFVQTDSSVPIGGTIMPHSVEDGSQYYIKLLWAKDGADGHWWLSLGDTWVGYYPRERFDANGIQSHAAIVQFGGEVIDTPGDGAHTRTDMGSGNFSGLGWQKAAYQRNIRYVDTDYLYQEPTLQPNVTDPQCYDLSLRAGGTWGTHFFFGGSGNNTGCR